MTFEEWWSDKKELKFISIPVTGEVIDLKTLCKGCWENAQAARDKELWLLEMENKK